MEHTVLQQALDTIAARMMTVEGTMQEDCPIGIIDMKNWEWPQGVGLYGLYRLWKQTGKQDYLAFLMDWYNSRIREGLPSKNVNTMAPMLALSYLCEETGSELYRALCVEWAQYAMDGLPRTPDGGIQHVVSGVENRGQLWDDTLYMTVLFLARMGVLCGNQAYLDESVKQFLVHIKYLADKRTGLWYHGWTFEGRHNFANAFWGRGNCWITAGMMDYLEMAPVDGGTRQFLLDTVNAQIEALERLQRPDGMWGTLLDDPDSYAEASATAGFGYGILKGVRLGFVPRKFLPCGIRALEAVMQCAEEDGTVGQVSYGTPVGETLDDYRRIPLCTMTYGQALAMLVLSEGLYL